MHYRNFYKGTKEQSKSDSYEIYWYMKTVNDFLHIQHKTCHAEKTELPMMAQSRMLNGTTLLVLLFQQTLYLDLAFIWFIQDLCFYDVGLSDWI